MVYSASDYQLEIYAVLANICSSLYADGRRSYSSISRFLNSGTIDILIQIIICWLGGWRILFCELSDVQQHPWTLPSRSQQYFPAPVMIIKNVFRHCEMPPRGRVKLPPAENHCSVYIFILYNSHKMSQIFS